MPAFTWREDSLFDSLSEKAAELRVIVGSVSTL